MEVMKDLLFNVNSIESWYGENVLTSVVQIYERINAIKDHLSENDKLLNDFEKKQFADKLDKLIELNKRIQQDLEQQYQTIEKIKSEFTIDNTIIS